MSRVLQLVRFAIARLQYNRPWLTMTTPRELSGELCAAIAMASKEKPIVWELEASANGQSMHGMLVFLDTGSTINQTEPDWFIQAISQMMTKE